MDQYKPVIALVEGMEDGDGFGYAMQLQVCAQGLFTAAAEQLQSDVGTGARLQPAHVLLRGCS